MRFDEVYAIGSDGEILDTNSEKSAAYYSRKKLICQPCASYSYDEYELLDEHGSPKSLNTGTFILERIWTSGTAAEYCLNVKVVSKDGEEYTADFYNDIHYSLRIESYIIQTREWGMDNPFPVVSHFLSEIELYGIRAYKEIHMQRRKTQELELKLQYANYELERYRHISWNTEELVLKEGLTKILDREFLRWGGHGCDFSNIKKIILPSTLESIGQLAFTKLSSLETIICKAVTPPQGEGLFHFWNSGGETTKMYVPKESLEAYKSKYKYKNILPIEQGQ